jgi:FlaA1/EpsC-like NDP-sugar epimerase
MSLSKNKKILVTGGTGSPGKELVRYLLKYHNSAIIHIYDPDETEGAIKR